MLDFENKKKKPKKYAYEKGMLFDPEFKDPFYCRRNKLKNAVCGLFSKKWR